MRERIEPDTSQPVVELGGPILNEMCAHALEAQPEECCGLIIGSPSTEEAGVRFERVFRCRNDMTRHHKADPQRYPRDGREAYYMNEADYLRASDEAEREGGVITAVYHSHVGAGAYFSEMDQEFAEQPTFPFPEAAQFVLAVWGGRVAGVGLFERGCNGGPFLGRSVDTGGGRR